MANLKAEIKSYINILPEGRLQEVKDFIEFLCWKESDDVVAAFQTGLMEIAAVEKSGKRLKSAEEMLRDL